MSNQGDAFGDSFQQLRQSSKLLAAELEEEEPVRDKVQTQTKIPRQVGNDFKEVKPKPREVKDTSARVAGRKVEKK